MSLSKSFYCNCIMCLQFPSLNTVLRTTGFMATSHWMFAPSEGHDIVDKSFCLPEEGNRSTFRNVVLSSSLEFRILYKFQKPSDSD
jgi:hypothetical protein